MKKFLITNCILCVSMILTGCISITFENEISPEGDLTMSMEYDMSQILDIMKEGAEDQATKDAIGDVDNFCNGVESEVISKSAKNGNPFEGEFSCIQKAEGIFAIEIKTKLDEAVFQKENQQIRFNMSGANNSILSSEDIIRSDENTSQQFEESGEIDPAMLVNMGINIQYVIKMPGQVIDSPIGKINGNTVTIDLLQEDMVEGKDYWITSDMSVPVKKIAEEINEETVNMGNAFLQMLQEAAEQAEEIEAEIEETVTEIIEAPDFSIITDKLSDMHAAGTLADGDVTVQFSLAGDSVKITAVDVIAKDNAFQLENDDLADLEAFLEFDEDFEDIDFEESFGGVDLEFEKIAADSNPHQDFYYSAAKRPVPSVK